MCLQAVHAGGGVDGEGGGGEVQTEQGQPCGVPGQGRSRGSNDCENLALGQVGGDGNSSAAQPDYTWECHFLRDRCS